MKNYNWIILIITLCICLTLSFAGSTPAMFLNTDPRNVDTEHVRAMKDRAAMKAAMNGRTNPKPVVYGKYHRPPNW